MRYVLLIALLMPSMAMAQNYVPVQDRLTSEQREATGIAGLSDAQLKLLNEILSGQESKRQAEVVREREVRAEREATLLETLDGRPVSAVLKGTFAKWEPGTVVELDTGQRWKVMKGYGKLRAPKSDFPVKIVPGVAGRWFMEFDETLPKARVYRID